MTRCHQRLKIILRMVRLDRMQSVNGDWLSINRPFFLFAVTKDIGQYGAVISQDPQAYSIIALTAIGLPAIALWNFTYGGYSGSLKPSKAIELLQTEDSLLVDIRSNADRAENGVLSLRLGARGKGITIPYEKISSSISRQVKDPRALALELLGLQIASAGKLQKNTKVIILDRKGAMGKEVARITRKCGIKKIYYIEGGFESCRREGIKLENSTIYEDGPLALAADTAEALTNETKNVLQNPVNAAVILSSITGTALFVTYFHEILRYIGVLGIEATVILRLLTYDSPVDALDDLQNIRNSISRFVSFPTNVVQMLSSPKAKQ